MQENFRRFGRLTDKQIRKAKTKPATCSAVRWRIELQRREMVKKMGHCGRYDSPNDENRVHR